MLRNPLLIALLILITGLSFSSCGPDDYNYDHNYYQISQFEWSNTYWDNGIRIEQVLDFGSNGYGGEWFYENNRLVDSFYFTWYWENGYRDIVLEYGIYDRIYFTNVRIEGGIMTGYFDGVFSTFRGY